MLLDSVFFCCLKILLAKPYIIISNVDVMMDHYINFPSDIMLYA